MSVSIGDLTGEISLEDRFTAIFNAFEKRLAEVEGSVKQISGSIDRVGESFGGLGRSIATIAGGVLTGEVALKALTFTASVAADAIGSVVRWLPEVALAGAGVADVEENFQHLAEQTGLLGNELLGALREGTHSTISNFDLMKLASRDLAAGLNLTSAQFGTLAKGAFVLAQATGTDVKSALDTMNDAMLTGRTRTLALLTGKIDLQKAEEKFAATLGMTAKSLSEAGKLEAARVAILDSVAAATERLGVQTDGLDELVAQAQTAWANFRDELGKVLATSPVLIEGFNAIKDAIVGTFGGSQDAIIKNVVATVDDLAISVVSAAKVIVNAAKDVVIEWYAVEKLFGNLIQIVDGVRLAILLAEQASAFGIGKIMGDMSKWAALDREVLDLEIQMKARGDWLKGLDRAQQDVVVSASALVKKLDEIQARMAAARAKTEGFVGPLQEQAKAHVAAGAAADGQSRFLKANEEAASKTAEAHKKLVEELFKVERAGYRDATAMSIMAIELTKIGERDDSVLELAKAFEALAKTARDAYNRIQQVVGFSWPSDLQDLLKNLGSAGEGVLPATRITVPPGGGILPGGGVGMKPGLDLGKAFSQGFQTGIHDIPNAILRAIEGGGSVVGAVAGTLGRSVGDSISGALQKSIDKGTKGLTNTILSGLTDMIPVVGALLGPLFESIAGKLKDIFGGPSKEELAGRDVVAQFEQQFASTQDMINKVGDAFAATGRTREEAQAAIKAMWDAEKQGAEASAEAIARVQGALDEMARQQDLLREASSLYGLSETDRQAAIVHAQEIMDAMLRAGTYTQEQLNKAYFAWQEALAAAGDAAAQAWIDAHKAVEESAKAADKAMSELERQRDALAQSIAAEAPEEEMGVIERQQREQLAAIEAQMDAARKAGQEAAEAAATSAQEAADAQSQAAEQSTGYWRQGTEDWTKYAEQRTGELGEATATGFADTADAMKNSFTESADEAARRVEGAFAGVEIRIPIFFDVPDLPTGLPIGNRGEAPEKEIGLNERRALGMQHGGFGYAPGPQAFTTQGDEFFAFGGEGEGISGLFEKLPSGDGAPVTLQVVVGGRKVKDVVIDELESAPTSRDARVIRQVVR